VCGTKLWIRAQNAIPFAQLDEKFWTSTCFVFNIKQLFIYLFIQKLIQVERTSYPLVLCWHHFNKFSLIEAGLDAFEAEAILLFFLLC
jgi:hypothetical protein